MATKFRRTDNGYFYKFDDPVPFNYGQIISVYWPQELVYRTPIIEYTDYRIIAHAGFSFVVERREGCNEEYRNVTLRAAINAAKKRIHDVHFVSKHADKNDLVAAKFADGLVGFKNYLQTSLGLFGYYMFSQFRVFREVEFFQAFECAFLEANNGCIIGTSFPTAERIFSIYTKLIERRARRI